MASLARFAVGRSLLSSPYWRRSISLAYCRKSSSDSPPGHREGNIVTDSEHSYGIEKKEIDALMDGVEDPFNLNINRGPRGTKERPTLVPSLLGERIVGCVCEKDATHIKWMTLPKGDAKRCHCGHWFKLIEANPNKIKI
ncbi:PREDICTED: cytochrome c oxidase subunit 5B, mitochondrial-like [Amphimedon queenslandica]|uniref:Cytochrome c oxidase subunit 5B, mitochondrial n=1 Tax=Amphimedon queenslandica TaxID=400682 RepID=A0A1X7VGL2_AMPQE|nr:PREDICTED: cytochrome c oxidase subunit 5B, mitochondrial-like [Amphimedon queenslandica]|eukprot:XP_003384334.1 PREDICTED: cytochrome c oxidase subunit 5B, mitochondrial-like [Amphimedon queenslandica]